MASESNLPDLVDIGAGNGIYSEYLCDAGAKVRALDPSPQSMQLTGVEKIHKVLEQADIPSESADGIHIKDSLEHIADKRSFFEHCGRILRPRGIIVCVFEEANILYSLPSKFFGGPRYYSTTYNDIVRKGKRANIEFAFKMSWLPNPWETDWYSKPTVRTVAYGAKI